MVARLGLGGLQQLCSVIAHLVGRGLPGQYEAGGKIHHHDKVVLLPLNVLPLLVGAQLASQIRRLYGIGVLFHQRDIVRQPSGYGIRVHVDVQVLEHALYADERQLHAVQHESQCDEHRCRMATSKPRLSLNRCLHSLYLYRCFLRDLHSVSWPFFTYSWLPHSVHFRFISSMIVSFMADDSAFWSSMYSTTYMHLHPFPCTW